jgi:hypothetical protein
MTRLELPELLMLVAAVVALFGVSRVFSHETDPRHGTRHALMVWLALLAGGISLWLLTVFQGW